ncbi:class F sortase [Arthrobacter sp. ES1]|uniref:class F sortase n=1 Tax=Arthrobacter sp. ES1 TaxID=1897056 RepID=UPI001CFF616E|nr:class F sortase [Arthrobacter sp. ES1]MCB5280325.1 hypothetical protein [Arthrobacter sp. ES1]
MSEESWTPPPSRLTGQGFGTSRNHLALRPPSRFPGLAPELSPAREQPSLQPPSRLGGYTFTKAPLRPARKRRIVLVALVTFIVLSLGAGTAMVVAGNTPVAQDAPLPASPDQIAPADQKPVGPDGIGKNPVDGQDPTAENPYPGAVQVENADTGGGDKGWLSPRSATPVTIMSTELMEPMSVFVPAAKLYSLARPSDSFVPSKYAGFSSITIPDNPHRTVWHASGGAMAGTNADGSPAAAGTTFLGSHSGYAGLWGAYVNVAYLKGGETVWTKDAKGKLQRWQVDRVRYMPHTQLPQEYWKADGPRRLVLTTCGGTAGADGIYNENVFVEAKPVAADGSASQDTARPTN